MPKLRKPTDLRTRNIFAVSRIDEFDKVVVTITDRGRWTEIGCKIPSNKEMEQLTEWVKKVRAFSRSRKVKV